MIAFGFSFFFPFLLVMAAIQLLARSFGKKPLGWLPTIVLGVISAITVITPLRGLPLGRWLISLNGNFSIPLTAILMSKVLENGTGIVLLDRKTLSSTWIFGLGAGILLYPMALGLGGLDPYRFGWGFSWLFVFLLVTTLVLLFLKNRLGIILMACVLCYDLHLLESQNMWDYLVDPFFVIASGIALGNAFVWKLRNGKRRHH